MRLLFKYYATVSISSKNSVTKKHKFFIKLLLISDEIFVLCLYFLVKVANKTENQCLE